MSISPFKPGVCTYDEEDGAKRGAYKISFRSYAPRGKKTFIAQWYPYPRTTVSFPLGSFKTFDAAKKFTLDFDDMMDNAV